MKNAFHKRHHHIVSCKANSRPQHSMEAVMRLQLQKLLDRSKKTKESRKLLAPFSYLKESLLTTRSSTEMKPQYLRQVSLNSSDLKTAIVQEDEIHVPMNSNKRSNNNRDHHDQQSNCIFDDFIQDCCDFVENQDMTDEEEYYDNMAFNDTFHERSIPAEFGRATRRREDDTSHYNNETKQRHCHGYNQHSQSSRNDKHISETECNNSTHSPVLLYHYDRTTSSNERRTYNQHHDNTTMTTNLDFPVQSSKDFSFNSTLSSYF